VKDPIPTLVKSATSFSEKGHQLNPSSISALDIQIESRYGKISEMIDMLRFVELAASRSVAHYVKSIVFDSKIGSCFFVLSDHVTLGSEIERELFAIACECFTGFQWFDDDYWSVPHDEG
jgi:hypothetical protein